MSTLLPQVTIVTPTLNQATFIDDTMRSIAAQTYARVEHIVVDGGSTDTTAEIVGKYLSSGRVIWSSEPDDGMYAAVNKGLRMASGDILAYLNSDDVYFPWAVEFAVDFLQEHPDVDLIYGDAVNVDDQTGAEHLRIQPSYSPSHMLAAWSIPQPSTFWRASLHDRIGFFDESLRVAGDFEFFLRAGLLARVQKVDEVLSIERLHDATKSVRLAGLAEREKAQVRTRFEHVGIVRRPLDPAIAFVARRARWAHFLAVQAGVPGAGAGWSRLRRDGRPELSLVRIALGAVPGIPLAMKSGSIRVCAPFVTTRRDRAEAGRHVGG